MRLLTRHVGLHVLLATLLVLVALLGLFAIAMFADELGDAAENFSVKDLLYYTALKLPGLAVANIGFAMLIGCLMGLGVLASQSELTVMRAAGVSVKRIVWMVIKPMLLLVIAATALGEYVVPAIERHAGKIRVEFAEQKQAFGLIDSTRGMWLVQGNDFMHFNHVTPKGEVFGFARLMFNEQRQLTHAQYAARGQHVPEAAGQPAGWRLEKVRTTQFAGKQVSNETPPALAFWASDLDPELLSVVVSEPASMSVRELLFYRDYLTGQGQDSRNFSLVLWQKLLQPLAMLGLVVVAIAFIFGPLRGTTLGYKLFTGVLVGIAFRFSQDLLGPVSLVYGFTPIVAVALPIAVCWLVGTLLLMRVR